METPTEVELYEFTQAGETWRYTPHEFDVEVQGMHFVSMPIARNRLQMGAEAAKAALEVTVPPTLPLLARLLHTAGDAAVMMVALRIARLQDVQTVWLEGLATRWLGRVLGAEASESEARIRCESVSASMKRIGLRRLYSRKCSHVLYSIACGAAQVSASAVVQGVQGGGGLSITLSGGIPAGLAGALPGGWLETPAGSRHMITAESGDGVVLLAPAALQPGDAVTLVAGCDHTTTTCQGRFNNLDNFGGFPGIPQKNPFSTGVF